MSQAGKSNAPFSFDIWSQVLRHLATSFASPYNLDDVETMPIQRRRLSWEKGSPCMEQWLDLRLVCREWADWSWTPFKPFEQWDNIHDHTKGPASWIYIYIADTTFTRFCDFIRPHEVASQVVTLSISCHSAEGFQKALWSGTRLPNVHNLSLTASGNVPHDFWPRLCAAFPNIVVLRVRGFYIEHAAGQADEDNTVIIPHLRHLEIDNVSGWSLEDIDLPSLRHLVIRGHAGCSKLVKNNAHQLEYMSLDSSCCTSALLYLPDCFWTEMPRLQVIELPAFQITRSPPPPPGHALRYLVVQRHWGEEHHHVMMAKSISDWLPTYSEIRKFSINTQGWTFWEKLWLQIVCYHLDIEIVSLPATLDEQGASVVGQLTRGVTRTLNFLFIATLLGLLRANSGLRWAYRRIIRR